MFARHRLKTQGYIVLYHAIPEEMANSLRPMTRNDQNFWIHDTWDGVLHGEYRLRAFVSDADSQSLSEYLSGTARAFFLLLRRLSGAS
ncbi:hypothetical protein PC129_g13807 [Phytophthora cactorum]|uniref:Uncharacterized protein n=1 Tax=Phytophthora cactorum TaxID=29920 RepID=A0A329RRA2_9STRA|nr:hypothetical protein Pcac1_g4880 [Phytophthora cactorum]KAG2811871.1 hypothetical protein PC111_g15045 [Phytophthora cactorum]KAG2817183.1 hypothetical protein PC112_g13154 [Phytophthora cactorum]KAG2828779.1 hypothetical protein PC113_g21402 [Phytophthora cactorum]KAG2876893.1 hypothetical protein PC114_g23944 [Phytophthora cactorum]